GRPPAPGHERRPRRRCRSGLTLGRASPANQLWRPKILALMRCPGYSSGSSITGAKPRGCRLRICRAAIPVATIVAAILQASGARAVEAVNVRLDAPAIDLTDVVERQHTENDRIQ